MYITVISGGTAANSLVGIFSQLSDQVTYVLPISDNGGSTSEILRVIGGPAVGDIRSRIMNLLPNNQKALKTLFSYRLNDNDESIAKQDWNCIIDGTHELWNNIESHVKEMIRPFFLHIHVELLKRSKPGREFCFLRASIGNLFLTGARLFCGSLESAIALLCCITGVPNQYTVIPCINSNFSYHISAELHSGKIITGQSQISHPSEPVPDQLQNFYSGSTFEDEGHMPFLHPDLASSQLKFSKNSTPLVSPIKRILYINPYGQEIHPRAAPRVSRALAESDMIIYSIGSLYTSIIPTVILGGFASEVIKCKKKVLLLNGSSDRETKGMNAFDHIHAIVLACQYSLESSTNQDMSETENSNKEDWSRFVTDLVYLDAVTPFGIETDVQQIEAKNIHCHKVKASKDSNKYDTLDLLVVLRHIFNT